MKSITRFLLLALTLVPCAPAIAAVSTTAGSNLTAFNGNTGAMNNNAWNQMMNTRGSAPATADFGNCNSVILRCAQPKCASGGCTTMEIAAPIVSGCVMSNDACKQYGDELVQYISAQLVANSTAKANAQAAAAQNAAAQAAAQQSAQQLQQMQAQMQQMQSEMANANAAATAQLQAALEEQKQLTAQAIADAAAAQTAAVSAATAAQTSTTNDSQVDAASRGVSADVLAREQISGQIMTKLDNAAVSLKEVRAAMENAFQYAGCDNRGNNCTGPKRAKTFKQKALNFFDPYENVLDELYDALIMAQSVGVDITDIYMMLNGTCNAWAKYLCSDGQVMHYTNTNCKDGRSVTTGNIRGGARCAVGQVVPMSDGGCQLIQMLTSDDEVQQNWLYPEQNVVIGDDGKERVASAVRVGCASEALDNSMLFRGRKKQATIDIETLQRIIEQDAPATYGTSRMRTATHPNPDGVKFCAVNSESLQELQKSVSLKQLPKKVCVADKTLVSDWEGGGAVTVTEAASVSQPSATGLAILDCSSSLWANSNECKCRTSGGTWWGYCVCPQHYKVVNHQCEFAYGTSNFKLPEYESPLKQNMVTAPATINFNESSCTRRNGSWYDNKCWCHAKEMPWGMKCESYGMVMDR